MELNHNAHPYRENPVTVLQYKMTLHALTSEGDAGSFLRIQLLCLCVVLVVLQLSLYNDFSFCAQTSTLTPEHDGNYSPSFAEKCLNFKISE